MTELTGCVERLEQKEATNGGEYTVIVLDGDKGRFYDWQGHCEADAAIGDYMEAGRREVNPEKLWDAFMLAANAYARRAFSHFKKGDFDKAWADVKMCQQLRYPVDRTFLADLREASGREE